MSLLTPDLGLLFWMLLSFLLVFGALAKFGFPIITGMVDKRRAHITEALAEADKARLKLESVEEDARRMMEEATRRSQELTATAVEESNRIVESARQRADQEVAQRMEVARNQIEIEKERALGELRTTVALLSVEVAEKVMGTSLADDKAARGLVERFIDEAEGEMGHSGN